MTGLLGSLCLSGATVAWAGAAASGLAAWQTGEERWLARARGATVLGAALLLGASALLAWMLLSHDFTNAYVFAHTDRSLGVLARLSAFWAGQEGSILLWALMLALMSSVHAWRAREGVSVAVLGGIVVFFAGLLVFAANPFETRAGSMDGSGMNPMLRHWAMALHPPLLFMGYAGFAVPMAMVFGGLVQQRSKTDIAGTTRTGPVIRQTLELRRWAIFAWVCLSLGMALGAWWAYVELGWGGYWAWDPVENASLAPWLTGLALVHAMVAHRKHGGFSGWVAWLSVGTFSLCVLGTALTRSGLLQSVHAFAQSSVGLAFFGLLAGVGGGGASVLVARRKALSGGAIRAWSVEGVIHAGLWVLVAMAGATLAGTVLPLLSGATGDAAIVGPAYYGRTVLPLAVVLMGLMGAAELAREARAARAWWMAGGAAGAVVAAAVTGLIDWRFMACAGVCGMVVGSAGFEGWRTAGGSRTPRPNIRGSGGSGRCWSLAAHVGMGLLATGVAGSSVFAEQTTTRLGPGESVTIGQYTLVLEELRRVRGEGWEAGEAVVRVRRGDGREAELRPQQRFYERFREASTEVSVRSGLDEDVSVALLGWTVGGTAASIAVHVNPLTSWIWAGAGLMALGGAGSMLPRPARSVSRRASVAEVEPSGAWSAAGSRG
ncbi:MAG: cytochrome c biogenesis protein CcsA [Phycisphaerales bacterium]|nr:cytochrome c biogenesis protein CcsA [Phycisphaerales bacterium]